MYGYFAAVIAMLGLAVAGCDVESNSDRVPDAPLEVAAGVRSLEPTPGTALDPTLALERLRIESIAAIYELTTPAGEPFSFHMVSRAGANTGAVRVAVGHVRWGDETPAGGAESLAQAGIVPFATGTRRAGNWLEASGDGFARMSLTGSIADDQVLAVRAKAGGGVRTCLVHLRIGPPSEINEVETTAGDYSGVQSTTTLYSSDSWWFALPTVATSGDRISIVTYDGDRTESWHDQRYEVRLQYDPATGAVTGGGSEEVGTDSGNWRDHEIAALYNVLAMVRSGTDDVTIDLSFDRGATIGQTEVVEFPGSPYSQRLVQVAMALDYTLAVVFWRNGVAGTDLILLEGRPSEFDSTGSPTMYEFGSAEPIHRAIDAVPLLMGVEYSEGGDLVIGYGWTQFIGMGNSRTQMRCATRLFGSEFVDLLVEEDRVTGMDPSVALLGAGDTLEIYYAYETRDGIRLAVAAGPGGGWAQQPVVGGPLASMPSVFARESNGERRVDLLYLTAGPFGTELHVAVWRDFPDLPSESYHLSLSQAVPSALPAGLPPPGVGTTGVVPPFGLRITQVSWFGYDATLDEEGGLVVAYNEQTYDAYTICALGFEPIPTGPLPPGTAGAPPLFVPVEPPPLAPGMTEPMPPPEPAHMNQLRLLRLE